MEELVEADRLEPETTNHSGQFDPSDTGAADPHTETVVDRSDRVRGSEVDDDAATNGSAVSHDDPASPNPDDWPHPHAVARCRWCRSWIHDPVDHHAECSGPPEASCRFCGSTLETDADHRRHWYDCDRFQSWYLQESGAGDAVSRPSPDDPDAVGFGTFVRPQPHEFGAFLKYDTDTGNSHPPFQWYTGLQSLCVSADGTPTAEFTYDATEVPDPTRDRYEWHEDGRIRDDETVETWTVDCEQKTSNLVPPDRDRLDDWVWPRESVRELVVHVYPASCASHDEAEENGRRRVSFTLCPRWPGQESENGQDTNPIDLVGVDVEVRGTFFEFDRYPTLLRDAVGALSRYRRSLGGLTECIAPESFERERLHPSSVVVDGELYLRVYGDETGRVHGFDGTLGRIGRLLTDLDEGYSKRIRDDRGCRGYYHTTTIGSLRAAELADGHRLAKEFKHYHVREPQAVDPPLSEPKVAVSLQYGDTEGSVYWSDLSEVRRELDESLLCLLSWSDVSTSPDGDTYVEDDYFAPVRDSRFRRLVTDPTPGLEQRQERRVRQTALVSGLTDVDVRLLRTLLRDGREFTRAGLADEIQCAERTVGRSLERLSSLVDAEYGDIGLRSEFVAEQLLEILPAVERADGRETESLVEEFAEVTPLGGGNSNPWEAFCEAYVESSGSGGERRRELSVGWDVDSPSALRRLLRRGASAWQAATGAEHAYEFAREFTVEADVSGDRVQYGVSELRAVLPGGGARSTRT